MRLCILLACFFLVIASSKSASTVTKTARRQAALRKLQMQKAAKGTATQQKVERPRQATKAFGRRLTQKKKRVKKRKPPVRKPSKEAKAPRNPMVVAATRHREKLKQRKLEEAKIPKPEKKLPRANFHHFFNKKTKLAHHVDRPDRLKRNAPPPPISRMERLRMKKRNQDAIRTLRARKMRVRDEL